MKTSGSTTIDGSEFNSSYTYLCSGGPTWTIPHLTKGHMHSICAALGQCFGDGYSFMPAQFSEGGIVFTSFPEGQHKSLRFCLRRWPDVPAGWMHEWHDSNDIIVSSPIKITAKLKAFYGAPVWTEDELIKFNDVLSSFGWQLRISSNQRSVISQRALRELSQIGPLGDPR